MFEGGSGVRLLEADPDLAAELDARTADQARAQLVARVDTIDTGSWDPKRMHPQSEGHLGVLVLEGLMTRDVVIARTACAELVGRGDLLRPWDGIHDGAAIKVDVEWHVLEQTRVALIDRRLVQQLGYWPEILSVMVLRSIARAHALSLSLAITCMTGLNLRLLILFWHLADRWGRVRPDGVLVPLALTHRTVGRLVGASRPSVSTALKQLECEGELVPHQGGGWILQGEPPEDLAVLYARRPSARASSS
jgi:CRP/FNR family cyclic AMP-dependent transcriptional regulator